MAALTTDAAKETKQLRQVLLDNGQYKLRSEAAMDAIRQFALKYSVKGSSIERVRKAIGEATKKSGKTLSQTIVEMRAET
ncbi:hypothetical protein HYV83_05645 [Candidatus Woesearchaeota archaeon]|nr:hypothetical protein [Candidatus Woesearchaeota archaeon]